MWNLEISQKTRNTTSCELEISKNLETTTKASDFLNYKLSELRKLPVITKEFSLGNLEVKC